MLITKARQTKLRTDYDFMSKRGWFIVFEGVDRSGKSSLARNIGKYLDEKQKPSELYCFPNRNTEIGRIIDRYLKANEKSLPIKAVHMLFSANRWECISDIKEKLSLGVTVLCDRYSYSGIAYSRTQGLEQDFSGITEYGLLCPDVVIYLDVGTDHLVGRPGFGDELYEKSSFLGGVSEQFRLMRTSDTNTRWYTIDASKTQQEVLHDTIKVLEPSISEECTNPIKYFSGNI